MARPWMQFYRNFSRWSHRTPSKVLLPEASVPTELKREEIVDLSSAKESVRGAGGRRNKAGFKNNKYQSNVGKTPKNNANFDFKSIDKATHFLEPPKRQKSVPLAESFPDEASLLENVFDPHLDYAYRKLPNNEKQIGKLLMGLKSKRERNNSNLILVEGWRLIAEGLRAGHALQKLIFSDVDDLQKLKIFLPKTDLDIYKMPYKEMKAWSSVESCPGLMGVFKMPSVANFKRTFEPIPLDIVCDNVREPGNLGAIFRGALGAGVRNVFLTKGCTDMWDSKVVRSAAGAHFHLPVYKDLDWQDIRAKSPEDTAVFIADSNAIADACKDGLVLKDKVYYHGDRSKNPDSDDFVRKIEIPLIPYHEVEYGSVKSIMLVVGGETEGISEDCYRFAHEKYGTRLNIPLTGGVDSLNVGSAFAVIAFEIKRQLSKFSLVNTKESISNG